MTSKSSINLITKDKEIFINGDEDQLNRVFINLIKNSQEAIDEISKKDTKFKGNIDIEIVNNTSFQSRTHTLILFNFQHFNTSPFQSETMFQYFQHVSFPKFSPLEHTRGHF